MTSGFFGTLKEFLILFSFVTCGRNHDSGQVKLLSLLLLISDTLHAEFEANLRRIRVEFTQNCSCAAILFALDKVHTSMTLFSLIHRILMQSLGISATWSSLSPPLWPPIRGPKEEGLLSRDIPRPQQPVQRCRVPVMPAWAAEPIRSCIPCCGC